MALLKYVFLDTPPVWLMFSSVYGGGQTHVSSHRDHSCSSPVTKTLSCEPNVIAKIRKAHRSLEKVEFLTQPQFFLLARYTRESSFQTTSYKLPSQCTSPFLWITLVLLYKSSTRRREARRHKPTGTFGRLAIILYHSPRNFQPELSHEPPVCCSLIFKKVRKSS